MSSMRSIDAFLAHPAIAVVGVSRSGHKFGNGACRILKKKGYRVYPMHWSGAVVDGVHTYVDFKDLPERVNAVLVVVPPAQALRVVRDAAAAGIHHVWLQQGAESPEVLRLCRELGLDTVSGECILMFAQPTGAHRIHQWVRRYTQGLPA
jgi:predicted CoA-binding protein